MMTHVVALQKAIKSAEREAERATVRMRNPIYGQEVQYAMLRRAELLQNLMTAAEDLDLQS